jgi:hypothetical protein
VIDSGNMHTAAYLVDLKTKKFKLILRGEVGLAPAFLGVKGNMLLTLAPGERGFDIQGHSLF